MALNVSTVRRMSATLLALLLAAGTLAACGGDDADSSSGGSAASTPAETTAAGAAGDTSLAGEGAGGLALLATENGPESFGFDQTELTAEAGEVTLTLANLDTNKAPHAIAIEGEGIDEDGDIAQPGAMSSVTVDLKPGTYTFYCPVGDHEAEGMKGTLTVS